MTGNTSQVDAQRFCQDHLLTKLNLMPASESTDANMNCLKVTQVADCDVPQRYWDCIVKPGKASPDTKVND